MEEGDFREVVTVGTEMKADLDFAVVEVVEVTVGEEMGTKGVLDATVNEPKLTGKRGTSQEILNLFREKTQQFYR